MILSIPDQLLRLFAHGVLLSASELTTAVDAVQDGFIQAQCFAFKLTHDGSLPGEVSRKGLFCFSPGAHEALALGGAKLHLRLCPCRDTTAPAASRQLRGVPWPSLATHLAIQTSTRSRNCFPLGGFRGLEGKSIALRKSEIITVVELHKNWPKSVLPGLVCSVWPLDSAHHEDLLGRLVNGTEVMSSFGPRCQTRTGRRGPLVPTKYTWGWTNNNCRWNPSESLAEDNYQLPAFFFQAEWVQTATYLQLFISKSDLVEKRRGFWEAGLKLMILETRYVLKKRHIH